MRAERISIFYCAIFLGLGIFVPFFPVWLTAAGHGPGEIGAILAAQLVVRIIAGPAAAYVADRRQARRQVIVALSAASLLSTVGLSLVAGFWPILILSTLLSAAWMPIMPLIETLGVAESESGGADYGRMRLWGSLSFIAGSVGGGAILAATSSGIVIWLLIASFAALLAGAIALPREPRTIGVETAEPVRAGAVVALAMQPLFIAFVVGAGLIQAGHAVYYGFGTVHWQSTGLTANTIGMLWSVGVLAEIVLFLYGRRAVELCGPALLIVIGGVAGIIRWSVTSAEPGLAMLIAVQAIHGLTFGATHLGSILFIARATPARLQASAQGAYAAVSGGLIMAAVMSASGPLYAALGSGAYLAMAGVSALGAAFGAVVLIVWNGRRLTP